MTRTLLALAVVAIVATPAHAQAIGEGAGTSQCSALNKYYRDFPTGGREMDTIIGSWAAGFMTSGNYARRVQGQDSRDLSAMTFDLKVSTLRRWCKAHPDKQMMLGIMELFNSLPSGNDADMASRDSFK